MKSEAGKSKSGARIATLGMVMGLVLLSSLGVVGRLAASSKTATPVAIAPARASEAADVTAQVNVDEPEQHMAGHSEIVLQCD